MTLVIIPVAYVSLRSVTLRRELRLAAGTPAVEPEPGVADAATAP